MEIGGIYVGILLPGGDVDCVVWTCCEDGRAFEGAVALEFCGVGCCEDLEIRWLGESRQVGRGGFFVSSLDWLDCSFLVR